jgi:hypothetical protein
MVGEKYLLDFTRVVTMQKAHGIKKHLTWCITGIVKAVQQLDKNTEMSPVTCTSASYSCRENLQVGMGAGDASLPLLDQLCKLEGFSPMQNLRN